MMTRREVFELKQKAESERGLPFDDVCRLVSDIRQRMDREDDPKPMEIQCSAQTMRNSARTLLGDRIKSLQAAIQGLEALNDALPAVLPPEADNAVSELLLRDALRRNA